MSPVNNEFKMASGKCAFLDLAACARMALALGKLNFSRAVIGLTCMPTKPEPLNLGVPVVNFPRANAILARAQALLWVRDCLRACSHRGGSRIFRTLVKVFGCTISSFASGECARHLGGSVPQELLYF